MRSPKSDFIENQINVVEGNDIKAKKLKAVVQEPRPEVETPEFQEKVIDVKEPVKITLTDGYSFELPEELTLDLIVRKKIQTAMRSYLILANHWGLILSGVDNPIFGQLCSDNTFLMLALMESAVVSGAERFLSQVFVKPSNVFKDKLDEAATIILYTWILHQYSKEVTKQPKN